jgi:hypothetical protein
MKTLVIGLGLTLALIGQQANATSKPKKERACSSTASVAYTACVYEVLDDFWIATGKCKNIADTSDRSQCLSDLKGFPREGREECSEQREARRDLCEDLGEAPYDPPFEASLFVNPADIGISVAPNPYFPISGGRTLVYQGGDETVTVTFTGITKVISGVPCTVVRDVVELSGQVIEDTIDWFAQDLQGNVWYCGEAVQDFEDGELVSLDGSFKAGVNGAKPGILMKATPMVEDTYRLEFDLGNAEDTAEVLSLTGSATTPAISCAGTCLITEDTSPLSPDALENKYYAPGVGMILEVKPNSGERLELIQIID